MFLKTKLSNFMIIQKVYLIFLQFYANRIFLCKYSKHRNSNLAYLISFNASLSLSATLSQLIILNKASTKSVRLFLYFK